jgi:RNA polymerase sigma factor for flagellar operon FliA
MNFSDTVESDDILRRHWQGFAATQDPEARDFLVEHYLPLVRLTARRVHAKLPSYVDVDDLASAGTFGLMNALRTFDPDRGVEFETYCTGRIRGAILDELRAMDWAPRVVRSRYRMLKRAAETLEAELSRRPTDEELARHLGLSLRRLQGFQWDARTAMVSSLDGAMTGGSDSGRQETRMSVLADETAEDPSSKAMREDVRQILVRDLGRNERLVVILYYYERMTLREIGEVLDLSESRVSQIHSAVLDRLREQLGGRRLELMADLGCTGKRPGSVDSDGAVGITAP